MGQSASRVPEGLASRSLYTSCLPPTSIRLLTLLPGKRHKPLVTRLTIHALGGSSFPVFDAISYVWGDAEDTIEITCNGLLVSITCNLHSALSRVRHKRKKVVLWADAICINQAALAERSAQVSLMGAIYSAAQKVYVCLGDLSPDGDPATVEELHDLVKFLGKLEPHHPSGWPLAAKNRNFVNTWIHLLSIHQLPWFRRAWVLQEVGLAKDPRVLFDKWEFSYKVLINVTIWLSLPGGDFRFSCGSKIHSKWLDWGDQDDLALSPFDLLYDASYLKCKDPRDHIYAFLGHPSMRLASSPETFMSPDYTKEISMIFYELSTILVREGDIRFLGCTYHTKATLSDGLPSWVIRYNWWRSTNSRFSLPNPRLGEERTWNSCKGLRGPPPQLLGTNLQLYGITIDTIAEIFRIDWLLGNELEFWRKTNGMRISPSGLLDLCNKLPFAYRNEINRDDRTEVSKSYVSKAEYLLVTLGGGFLHESSVEQFSSVDVLDNLDRAFSDESTQGEGPEADASLFRQHNASGIEDENVGQRLRREIRKGCDGRNFAITDTGHYIQTPSIAEVGDFCCVIEGFPVPVMVRLDSNSETSAEGVYQFLGEAWSCGLMDGEGVRMAEEGLLREQLFTFR